MANCEIFPQNVKPFCLYKAVVLERQDLNMFIIKCMIIYNFHYTDALNGEKL